MLSPFQKGYCSASDQYATFGDCPYAHGTRERAEWFRGFIRGSQVVNSDETSDEGVIYDGD